MKTINCPSCNGFGYFLPLFPSAGLVKAIRENGTLAMEPLRCDLCAGKKRAHKKTLRWKIYGRELFEQRRKKRLTLREAARMLRIDPSNLSKMERGVIKPRALYGKLINPLDELRGH